MINRNYEIKARITCLVTTIVTLVTIQCIVITSSQSNIPVTFGASLLAFGLKGETQNASWVHCDVSATYLSI